jgi:hypothetical protein
MMLDLVKIPAKIAAAVVLMEQVIETIDFRKLQSLMDDFANDHPPASSAKIGRCTAYPPVFFHSVTLTSGQRIIEAHGFGVPSSSG